MEDLSREELLEMVKLQQQTIEDQKQRIEYLEKENDHQKQRIECLEKLVLDLNKKIIDLIETN